MRGNSLVGRRGKLSNGDDLDRKEGRTNQMVESVD